MSEREKLRDAVIDAARFWERELLRCGEGHASPGEGALVRAVRALDAAERPRFEARAGRIDYGPRRITRIDAYDETGGNLDPELAALIARLLNEHFAKEAADNEPEPFTIP